jgi:hypothetical protein
MITTGAIFWQSLCALINKQGPCQQKITRQEAQKQNKTTPHKKRAVNLPNAAAEMAEQVKEAPPAETGEEEVSVQVAGEAEEVMVAGRLYRSNLKSLINI